MDLLCEGVSLSSLFSLKPQPSSVCNVNFKLNEKGTGVVGATQMHNTFWLGFAFVIIFVL